MLDIYNKHIELVGTCSQIVGDEYDMMFQGAKKANGSKIRRMIKRDCPELYEAICLDFYNPFEYQSQRTETHLIYVHSMIDYFFRVI